jgi:putative oxidoreductase
VLGGYLAAHGAQKLFGAFEGNGLDATTAGFEYLGLTPAREMAVLAGASELGGGLLTVAGIADPLGPLAIVGAMTVASAVHRKSGPFSAKGGYELALTNLALAAVLAVSGPGRIRLSPRLHPKLTAAAVLGAAALTTISFVKIVTTPPPAPPAPAPEPAAEDLTPIEEAEVPA